MQEDDHLVQGNVKKNTDITCDRKKGYCNENYLEKKGYLTHIKHITYTSWHRYA